MSTKGKYDRIYSEMLQKIGEEYIFLDEKLTGFFPMSGKEYNGDLMVVGRSVNGWGGESSAVEFTEQGQRECFLKSAREFRPVEDDDDAMIWVIKQSGSTKGFNSKRSAFWRVIGETLLKLNICDFDNESWPSYLVWSNLYKISPSEGGNPKQSLINIQHDSCVELLHLELKTYEPKCLLFLTGIDWACPFLRDRRFKRFSEFQHSASKQVEDFGQLCGDTKFVVARHPQGKPEEEWTDEVSEAFKKMK